MADTDTATITLTEPTIMTTYTADILDTDGETFVTVDLRDLSAGRLAALRDEAGAAGDIEMVVAIDEVLADPDGGR